MKTIECVNCGAEVILKIILDDRGERLIFRGDCEDENCKTNYVLLAEKNYKGD